MAHAAKWPELVQFDLRGSPISDEALKNMGTLPNLRTLFLESPNLSDTGLMSIAVQPSLEVLGVLGCPLTDQGVAAIDDARFPKLIALNLSRTQVTADGISKLRLGQLRQLQFPDVVLTDSHWNELARMKNLIRVVWGERELVRETRRSVRGGRMVLDSFMIEVDYKGSYSPLTRFPRGY